MQLSLFGGTPQEKPISGINPKERIQFLRAEIGKHDQLDLANKSIISDTEYDKLYKELVALELQHPEFHSSDSPTQKISYVKVNGLEEVQHQQKVLSLGKINTEDELVTFFNEYPYELIGEWKEDGGSIMLTYDNGRLIDAITLGDSFKGQRVLHNMQVIPTVPKTIPYQGYITFRGECIMPYAEFDRVNVNGKYANPRNLACASFTMLDSKEVAKRGLKFVLFEVVTDIEGIETEEQSLLWGQSQGFTIDEYTIIHNVEELKAFIIECEKTKRKTLDHQVDGAVLKINNRRIRKSQGSTEKYPKGSVAYKFVASEEKTTLLDIIWTIGKSGQLCPNAVLKEVHIDGSSVSAATLHNWKYVQDRDIRIGDFVSVIKANDIIPKVVSAYKDERTGSEIIPTLITECPFCGGAVAFKDLMGNENENIFCQNEDCESRTLAKLKHFVSRDALNIKNLGEETIELFYELGLIKNYKDIFLLKEQKDTILTLEGFQEKKVANLLNSIEAAKTTTLSKFIYSFAIKQVGNKVSRIIENTYKNFDNIVKASKENTLYNTLISIKDIGPVIATNFDYYMKRHSNEMIEVLSTGLKIIEVEEPTITQSPITGKTFVITGDVNHFKNRKELQAKIESLGGKVTGSVSKNTNFLINNDVNSTSGKNRDAGIYNIPILSEGDFLKMIE